jgi:Zn-dependent M32 family carboxypeptidase
MDRAYTCGVYIYIMQEKLEYEIENIIIEGSLEVKLPTIWRDEKQSRQEAERRERLE